MATIIGIGIGCSKRKISGSSHIKETTRFYILPLENTEITIKQLGRLYTDGTVQYSFDDTTWHEFETKINAINVSDFYSNNLVYVRWTKQFYENLLMSRYEAFYLQSEMDINTVSELILIKQDDEYVWFVGDYGTIVDDPMMGRFMFAGSRSGNIRELGHFIVDCMMLEQEGSTVLCEGNGDMIEHAQFTHDYDNETVIIGEESLSPVKVSSGQKLYLKHSDDKIIDGGNSLKINLDCFYEIGGDLLELSGQSKETFNFYSYFKNTNKLQSCGDLLLPETLNGNNPNHGCFDCMFSDCYDLLIVPKVLPAKELYDNCYSSMFSGCSSLVNAPALPATTLANKCYFYMFSGCTSLVNAPALPATTLASSCYYQMFSGCSSLVNAPALPATTLASSCYSSMFYGCSSLVNAPALPATTLANNCYYYMFSGCSSLVNAPALPATTLANKCYYYMFSGCSSLVNAPALPATTLTNNCYYYMFYYCTSLVNAPALPATTLASDCYSSMFYGCSKLKEIYCNARYSSGTTEITSIIGVKWLFGVPNKTDCKFHKNPDWAGPTSRGANTIPSNWQIVNWTQDTM